MSQYLDRLKEAVATRRGILVLGTGVSMSLSGASPSADWIGLIKSGIDRIGERPGLDSWKALQGMTLEDAITRGDLDQLIGVASQVSSKLKGHSAQAYSDWLRDTVGSLKPTNVDLAKAIGSLNLPILTTNYDRLVEVALRRSSCDWTDQETMREVFKGEDTAVGHLHGIWTKPDTVVLSEADYTKVMRYHPGQFVQQSHYATKSFIYVGYGSGLDDPNFGQLLRHHSEMFPGSRGDHFRLCRDSEVSTLAAAHLGHDIRVVPYGSEHKDLAPFLRNLMSSAPRGRVQVSRRDNLAFAQEAILEPIRNETVVGAHLENLADCDLGDLTVPPVLLPVPHEQFASMQDMEDDLKPKRLDPEEIFLGAKVLILAGEELAGLSTALRWVIAKSALERAGAAPVFVDARNCTHRRNPLGQQVVREALYHRLIDVKTSTLPRHVLAVDNLLPKDSEMYHAVVGDILGSEAEFIVLGTRQGEELRLSQDLQAHGLPVEIAYLGKLGKPEISSLAEIVAPRRSDVISEGVLSVLRREHLPRNPFTVSLLISLFVQLGGSTTHSSETAVLDDYVSLLLGRNGPYLDARYSLNPQNRETVLAELAREFVMQRKGALSEKEAIGSIARYFSSVGWKEDPMQALESFREMRVLRVENDVVQFQQSSYLHLFAAKAAISDESFLQTILEDPVFYGPIVRHFSALVRNSERAVTRVQELLDDFPIEKPTGHIFSPIEKSKAPDEIGKLFDGSSHDETPEEHLEVEGSGMPPEVDEAEDYDFSDDTDRVPFPLVDQSELSRSLRMAGAVDLASRVLRDSDQMPNLGLKRTVFRNILTAWGATLDALEAEAVFEEPARLIVEAVISEGGLKEDKVEDFTANMTMLIPTFVIFSAVTTCLSSRKLLLTYDEVVGDPGFSSHDYGFPVAAMFAFDVNEKGWAKYLPELAKAHGDRWVVSEFIGMLATYAYRHQELAPEDQEALRHFLRERAVRRYTFSNDADRRDRLNRYDQRIMKERALNRRRRLSSGTTVAAKMLEGQEVE